MYELTKKNDKFDEEIDRLMKCLGELQPYTKEYAMIEKAVEKMEKIRSEEYKVCSEHARVELEQRKMDLDEKIRELENEIKERHHLEENETRNQEAIAKKRFDIFKLCVEIVGIVLPLVFCWIWMTKGMAFEETGVFTSKTFQGLAGKFTKFI